MKKTLLLLIALLSISNVFCIHKDIDLEKRTQKQPCRSQPETIITANLDFETLIVSSMNYTGNIEVIITGNNGFTYSYSTSDDHIESIDISTSLQGVYTLTITTSDNVYTGEFEL